MSVYYWIHLDEGPGLDHSMLKLVVADVPGRESDRVELLCNLSHLSVAAEFAY